MNKWTRAMFQPNLPLGNDGYVTACDKHISLSKEAAAEGMVLLKNDNNTLPLKQGCNVALFGKGSFDYVKGGGGSGDVTVSYIRNLYEGFKQLNGYVNIFEPLAEYYKSDVEAQYANGAVPGMTVEPGISNEMVDEARLHSEVAIITISRFSGEGWDRSPIEYTGEYNPWDSETTMPKIAGKIFGESDYHLTENEVKMIEQVKNKFDKIVVVLNIGGIMDVSWIKNDDKINAALHGWQAGMEGGLAMAEVLCGIVNPSGKLPDTFAMDITDYPSTENFHESFDYVNYSEDIYVGYRYFDTIPGMQDKICYPFGYGLSYTTFAIEVVSASQIDSSQNIEVIIKVTNTGDVAGKEVVQLYYSAPQGVLGKPAKELAAFAKTKLLNPGESQAIVLTFAVNDMASFDDLGKIEKSAYVLEKGIYNFYIGNSSQDLCCVDYKFELSEDVIALKLTSKCAPTSLKERLLADGTYEELPLTTPNNPNECIFEKMEPGTEEALVPAVRGYDRYMMMNPYKGEPFWKVATGEISLDAFMAQLSDEDLINLLGGQPNTSVGNTFGFGNLPEYGVPNIMTADGPAGVRIGAHCSVNTTAWPCATCLASTWNTDLVKEVGMAGAKELKENNLAVWLTPAVNIHRSPLCGRNFEYYSEDPFLTGKMGAAMVSGIQSQNVAASVKHFCVNNKETNRKHSDSRVSERALREIYLKGFEIIVKESDPWTIMSAYNIVNGHRASENHDLIEGILRGEWGFKGMVTSDWWTRGEHYKEILAGNDVKMACGFPERVAKAMEMGAITRADLEHCARHVLELILKID